ncbi:MAG: septum formation initiator family protein [Lachnospiraceae bacterium]|nr:septum formation initiator family protein [Lachnospiraceae bacterium]MDE6994463.1 septum formation initiator family protein [Lachnospiraceae bacterium]
MAGKAAYRKKRQNKMAMLLVTTVVIMMLIVVSVKSMELRSKRAAYTEREEALLLEIEAEQARAEEIEEYEKYTQTKKYVEEIAKNKLGLVYEGEIIFKDEN